MNMRHTVQVPGLEFNALGFLARGGCKLYLDYWRQPLVDGASGAAALGGRTTGRRRDETTQLQCLTVFAWDRHSTSCGSGNARVR